jgi:hypothetical protein
VKAGIPVIVVNHPVGELPGMQSLAAHLAERFPAVPVHHIPRGCMYGAGWRLTIRFGQQGETALAPRDDGKVAEVGR